jgi:lysozyme
MTMRMSAEGRKRLTAREGVRLKAYTDSVGVWTIGIGHTSAAGPPKVTPGLTLTRAEVDSLFIRDLAKYEKAVDDGVHVPLAQHEFDALVSICYNIGPGWFGAGGHQVASFVRRLNAGDRKGCAARILDFNKPPEIKKRRKSEQVQFLTPYKGEKPAPIPAPVPPPPDIPAPEPKPEPAPEPAKTPTQSKTLWASLAGIIASIAGALTDWKVAAVLCVTVTVIAFAVIGQQRLKRILERGI